VPHYVMRGWGTDYGGRHFTPRGPGALAGAIRKLVVVAPHPDRTSLDWICRPTKRSL